MGYAFVEKKALTKIFDKHLIKHNMSGRDYDLESFKDEQTYQKLPKRLDRI